MDFYFIVRMTAGTVEHKFITPYNKQGDTVEWNKRPRSFNSIVPARRYIKALREVTPTLKMAGADFQLAHVHVDPDGTLTTEWTDD